MLSDPATVAAYEVATSDRSVMAERRDAASACWYLRAKGDAENWIADCGVGDEIVADRVEAVLLLRFDVCIGGIDGFDASPGLVWVTTDAKASRVTTSSGESSVL